MNAKEVIEKSTEVWNNKDLHGWLALADERTEWSASGGVHGRGLEGAEAFWSAWQTAFPDNRVTLETIVCEGAHGVEESVFEGTHSGPLQAPEGDIPPTGRRVSLPFAGIHTVRDGKFATFRIYFDSIELLTQLGLAPEDAPA
jgi:predicted ester cyclase